MKRIISLVLTLLLISSVLISCEPTKIQVRVYEYEVVSVQRYVRTKTSVNGRATRQAIYYNIVYIGNNGNLYETDDFCTDKYWCEIRIGNENKYVIRDTGANRDEYLYLTKKTWNSLSK